MTAAAQRDKRVDAYISNAPDFAKPILNHLRELVHIGCPDVVETMKWSRPHFMHNGLLCGMSAFKRHCALGFWMFERVLEAMGRTPGGKNSMGHFGRITSLEDLPGDKELIEMIRQAVVINDSGAKRPAAPRPKVNRKLVVPNYVTAALKTNKKALESFERFSYSHKKEYVEWITEAKREETRQKRIATMLTWLSEGKSRHWKYIHC